MHSLGRKILKIYNNIKLINSTSNQEFYKKTTNTNFVQTTFLRKMCNTKPELSQNDLLQELSEGDTEKEHKLKVIMLEIDLLRQEGYLVPENDEMKIKDYKELLGLNSRSGRRKYLEFVFKNCRKRENRLKRKEIKALEMQDKKSEIKPKDIPIEEFAHTYDLLHNTLFMRIRERTMNNLYNHKLMQAMQFGQKLIIDCGYHKNMTSRENINCAKQLMLLFGENRIHDDPFDLHLCNYDNNSPLATSLFSRIPTMFDSDFPLNIHDKSYLDLFPKEKLVYLTPHCKQEMKSYDHDSIYIIGGIVDKMNQEPLSLAKAKQEKIRMAKFPLDKYLLWTGGSGKSLTLNQVVSILLDLKIDGNWENALRHVPRRKLTNFDGDSGKPINVTQKILEKRRRWTPANLDLNNLSFKHSKNKEEPKHLNRRNIKSLFDE